MRAHVTCKRTTGNFCCMHANHSSLSMTRGNNGILKCAFKVHMTKGLSFSNRKVLVKNRRSIDDTRPPCTTGWRRLAACTHFSCTVCTYVRYVCTHECVCACMCVCMCVCMYSHKCTYVYRWSGVCTFTQPDKTLLISRDPPFVSESFPPFQAGIACCDSPCRA